MPEACACALRHRTHTLQCTLDTRVVSHSCAMSNTTHNRKGVQSKGAHHCVASHDKARVTTASSSALRPATHCGAQIEFAPRRAFMSISEAQ